MRIKFQIKSSMNHKYTNRYMQDRNAYKCKNTK